MNLNGNMPTYNWSQDVAERRYNPGSEANNEPETKGLVTWLKIENPPLIISLHTWSSILNTNVNRHPEVPSTPCSKSPFLSPP